MADFEWDEAKRRGNLEKHGFDFADAGQVFDGVHGVRPSRFPDEERYIALGRIAGRGVAVIFTRREARLRIICISGRGVMKKKISRYSRDNLPPSMTDWARVDALTDEDITKAMSEDPDWQHDMDIDWSTATLVIPQPKKAISIRLDADILDHLRDEGPGYQRRINAILRTYVDAQKARPKKKRA